MHLVAEQSTSTASPCEPALDPRMSDAIQRARASLRQFFAALRLPRNGQTDFQLQAIFKDGEQRELVWLSDLNFNTRPATGIVSARPRIKTITYRQRVPFRPDQMSDWKYRDNGRLVGGFTLRIPQAHSEESGILARLKRRFIN